MDKKRVEIMMQAYADQEKRKEAIAFMDWIEDNALKDRGDWYLLKNHRRDRWDEVDEDCVKYSPKELYDLYLLHLQNNK